jgi:hypothetical protein
MAPRLRVLGLPRFVGGEPGLEAARTFGVGVASVAVPAVKFHAARADAPPAARWRWKAGPARVLRMGATDSEPRGGGREQR